MMSENTLFFQDKDGVLRIAEDVSKWLYDFVFNIILSSECQILPKEILMCSMCEQDLMDDPAIVSAIDEETEFTALVVSCLIAYSA